MLCNLGLKSEAKISAVPMGLRGTNVTCLLFFGWLALEINVRLGAEKELRLYHPYRVAFIFVDFGYEDITLTGLGRMQNR